MTSDDNKKITDLIYMLRHVVLMDYRTSDRLHAVVSAALPDLERMHNCHAKLVEACEAVLKQEEWSDGSMCECDTCQMVKAALAAARGEI